MFKFNIIDFRASEKMKKMIVFTEMAEFEGLQMFSSTPG